MRHGTLSRTARGVWNEPTRRSVVLMIKRLQGSCRDVQEGREYDDHQIWCAAISVCLWRSSGRAGCQQQVFFNLHATALWVQGGASSFTRLGTTGASSSRNSTRIPTSSSSVASAGRRRWVPWASGSGWREIHRRRPRVERPPSREPPEPRLQVRSCPASCPCFRAALQATPMPRPAPRLSRPQPM